MTKSKILEMLNTGQIDELKKALTEEVYKDELKKTGKQDAEKRFNAMKRWMKYANGDRKAFLYPAKNVTVNIAGETKVMNCFLNMVSILLTTESIDYLEDFDSVTEGKEYLKEEYLKFLKIFVDMPCTYEEVDLNALLIKAKAEGYKFKKSEINTDDFKYILKYKDLYARLSFLDNIFSIINDGEKAKVYYTGSIQPLFISTSVGYGLLLPMRYDDVKFKEKKVIELNGDG